MKILALDLGTHTGIAHNLFDEFTAETIHLAKATEITEWGRRRLTRRCDPRIPRFAALLAKLPAPDVVVFEDVQFSTYTLQCQLWSSLRAAVWLAFGEATHRDCVPVSTLKLFAANHGGATKEMMQSALRHRHPKLYKPTDDDNTTDAIWLWLWANHNLGRINRCR